MIWVRFVLISAIFATRVFEVTPVLKSWTNNTKFQQVFDLILSQRFHQLYQLANIDVWCPNDGDSECRKRYQNIPNLQIEPDSCIPGNGTFILKKKASNHNDSKVVSLLPKKLAGKMCEIWNSYYESGLPCLQQEHAPYFRLAYNNAIYVIKYSLANITSFCQESVNIIMTTSVLASHRKFRSDCSWDTFDKALALIDDMIGEIIPAKCKDDETIASWLGNLRKIRLSPTGIAEHLIATDKRIQQSFQDQKRKDIVRNFDSCVTAIRHNWTVTEQGESQQYVLGLCEPRILTYVMSKHGDISVPSINRFIESCLTSMTPIADEGILECSKESDNLLITYKNLALLQTMYNMLYLPLVLPPVPSYLCLAKFTKDFPYCLKLALKSEAFNFVRHFPTIKTCYKGLYTKKCPNPSETFLNYRLTLLWNETMRITKDSEKSDTNVELQDPSTMIKTIGDLQHGRVMYKKVATLAREGNCQLINEASDTLCVIIGNSDRKRVIVRDNLTGCKAEIGYWFTLESDLKRCGYDLNTHDYSLLYSTLQKFLCGLEEYPIEAFEVSSKDNNTKLLCFEELYPTISRCMQNKEEVLPTKGLTYVTPLCKPVIEMRTCFTTVFNSPHECLQRRTIADLGILTGFISDTFVSLETQLECNDTISAPENIAIENPNVNPTFIAIPIVLLLTVIVVAVGYAYKVRSTAYSMISKEELEEFENGIQSQSEQSSKDIQNGSIDIDGVMKQPYNKDFEIEKDQLVIRTGDVLGSGAFGQVVKGILTRDENGTDVAVKTVRPGLGANKEYFRALLFEIKVMAYIGSHPNIVNFLGAITKEVTKGKLFVVLEMCQFGALFNHLKTNRDKYIKHQYYTFDVNYVNNPDENQDQDSNGCIRTNMAQLVKWAADIAIGMNFLTTRKVIHGDLATRNVLINSQGVAKITDFGLSRKLYENLCYVKQSSAPLPWRWMAPECLESFTFSPASDVWAYGVLLWEMFTFAQTPYDGVTWSQLFIQRLKEGFRLGKPEYATDTIYNEAILECWRLKTTDRKDFSSLGSYFSSLYQSIRYEQARCQYTTLEVQ